jgi:hypothetical protein
VSGRGGGSLLGGLISQYAQGMGASAVIRELVRAYDAKELTAEQVVQKLRAARDGIGVGDVARSVGVDYQPPSRGRK